MNCVSFKKILILSLCISFSLIVCEAQSFDRPAAPKQQKSISKKPGKQKKAKVIGPKSAQKAQKEQDAKERRKKKDSKKAVKEFQNHALEIQSPEVRERIKQNKKDANANYKAKKRSSAARTKKGAKKYGK
jgi:DNA repair exonuclease SbcCD nuclease subunit